MRLLAEVFLPRTQTQLRESVSQAPDIIKDDNGKFGRSTLMLGGKADFQTIFKRNSMRPTTVDVRYCMLLCIVYTVYLHKYPPILVKVLISLTYGRNRCIYFLKWSNAIALIYTILVVLK